ncbi:MAG: four helix bundle protein [Verrucomicrobia bacterium]|nr:four helix bundle protein [Verrucomicrobiota bacterium]
MVDETARRRNGETAKKPVRHFQALDVYQNALATGLRVYELSKQFPSEEKYSLTDQIRRSSRSVCANIAEAWRKRRYQAAFVSKLSDAEGEAAETQVHLEFPFRHRYVSHDEFLSIDDAYEKICAQVVRMIDEPKKWLIRRPERKR